MMLPKLIRKMATPSIFQMNFSFRIMGARIALKTIAKQEVEEIKIMLPNAIATALST